MNRAARRAAARTLTKGAPVPPLCAPGSHAFARISGTVEGVEQVVRVVCRRCRRTFGQVMEQSPADLAIYRQWLEAELAQARGQHLEACPRRFAPDYPASDGCPGCARQDAATRMREGLG